METRRATEGGNGGSEEGSRGYRLERTAENLNRRYGLYLSEEQQRGLATGLLVGAVLAGAALMWAVGTSVRRTSRW